MTRATCLGLMMSLCLAAAWVSGNPSLAGNPDTGVSTRAEPNPIVLEPLLFYDVSGGTLAGSFHLHVSVYNSGHVTFAQLGNTWTGAPDQAFFRQATTERVEQLRRELVAAGAARARDNLTFISDVPLTTVTFFVRPGTTATANTFSYFGPTESMVAVNAAIQSFIEDVFPEVR